MLQNNDVGPGIGAAYSRLSEEDRLRRSRELIATGASDIARWNDERNLDPVWDGRARIAARLIGQGSRVLDIGCGNMALEAFLPAGCI